VSWAEYADLDWQSELTSVEGAETAVEAPETEIPPADNA
jgi:hypothetical protein